METLQYLARRGMALQGNEDGEDNFTQLLLLGGKDHPYIIDKSDTHTMIIRMDCFSLCQIILYGNNCMM